MHRRALLLAAAAIAAAPRFARAATVAPFDAAAFAAAQAAGRPILVDIWASWCPTCARQQPILSQIALDPAFERLAIFRVDFDAQKDVVRSLGARAQSTLVAFHGAQEVGRSVGDTRADSIRALAAAALSGAPAQG